MEKGLNMLDKMLQWNIVDSSNCVLCWREEESEEHLFYGCRFTKKIWKQLKQGMGYNRNMAGIMEDETQWLKIVVEGKGVQRECVKLIFYAFIYWIWHCRNTKKYF